MMLVLAGCGMSDQPGSRPPPSMAEPRFVEPVCPASAMPGLDEHATGTAIPEDFEVAWVLRCGPAESAVTERADTTAAELLVELRRPSDPLTNGVCPTILITPPYLFLVDATGRAVHPAFPTDACGQPRESAREAVAALDFQEESRTPLTR
jgi:hypothetical protein